MHIYEENVSRTRFSRRATKFTAKSSFIFGIVGIKKKEGNEGNDSWESQRRLSTQRDRGEILTDKSW